MDTKLGTAVAGSVIHVAAVAGMLFACNAAVGRDQNVTVAIHVSAKGLDLSQPADARVFYRRLKNAAWVACTRGDRADLAPVDDVSRCYEKALGGVVSSIKVPLLTQLYLATHTLQEASAYGIDGLKQIAGVTP